MEKSCATPAGTSTNLTSRINGMTTHTHMGQKKHDPNILILTVLMSGSVWLHFFVLDALPCVCMVRCGRPAVFVWLCKLHNMIGDRVLYHATVVSSTNLIITEESRRLHVVLYGVCSLHTPSPLCFKIIMLTSTTPREGLPRVGSLPCAPVNTYSRVVVQHVVLRSFRACTTSTRMQLEGRSVPCKQYCASSLQKATTIMLSGHDCIFLVEQP